MKTVPKRPSVNPSVKRSPNGEPPKMARNKIEAGTLAALAKGDLEEEDDDDRGVTARSNRLQMVWIGVLGALLGVSFLINLVLLVRRG